MNQTTQDHQPPSNPYYNFGQHLRAKHQLAGNEFVYWALKHIPDWSGAHILDAGGGWGRFTWALLDEYQINGRDVVLNDLSMGMLHTASEEAARRGIALRLAVSSIQALPFASGCFDFVMANHVLYHLDDMPQGVRELARVLQPTGQLLATTNSDKIVATIIDLHYQALKTLGIPFEPEGLSPFSMENGAAILANGFRRVETFYYEDEQLIHDVAEIRAIYETIGRYRNLRTRHDISENTWRKLPETVQEIAQRIIDRDGVLHSPTLMGAFVCRDPIQPEAQH